MQKDYEPRLIMLKLHAVCTDGDKCNSGELDLTGIDDEELDKVGCCCCYHYICVITLSVSLSCIIRITFWKIIIIMFAYLNCTSGHVLVI